MSNVRIVTDSTCDLSEELVRKYNITVVPLYVVFDETAYRDGIDLTTKELYERVDEINTLPKTSAPSPGDFINAFKPIIDNGEDIVYVSLSSKISSTFQNAVIAAQEFDSGRIQVFDSLNLSTGIGLLVLKAVDYANEGLGAKEIVKRLEELVPKVKTRFIINTMDYLYLGGRCNALQNFFGGILKIKPVVAVKDGVMILEEKIRGKREKVLTNMFDNVMLDKDNMDETRIFITHSMADEDAVYLKNELANKLNVKDILVTNAGCVISSHCGPLTIGILYISK